MEAKVMQPNDLVPTYREIAEIVGLENAFKLYEHFKGQQINMPQRIYSVEFVESYVREHYNGKNIRIFAKEFNYSERRIRQLLNGYPKTGEITERREDELL